MVGQRGAFSFVTWIFSPFFKGEMPKAEGV
ncbi:MAG: hypothetical protein POELPBGB_02263 [Bacteroidia bacterium]|nr:hypothetical protein [Bacteroidia bacterium]